MKRVRPHRTIVDDIERELWTSKRSNLTCVTVITWVFESFCNCSCTVVEFRSGTTQLPSRKRLCRGAIGRPTDDTGFGGTKQAHAEFAPARRLCIRWAPRRRRCGQVGDAEMSHFTSSGRMQVAVCKKNCVGNRHPRPL